MKIIGFLVLALIANVIADDEEVIQTVATFELNPQIVKTCLDEAGLTKEKIPIAEGTWNKIIGYEDLNEETKESLTIQCRYKACILEKKDMMKDSKLVVEKILEAIGDKENEADKKVIMQCLSSLNEDDELTQEDRALGFTFCILNYDNVGKMLKNAKKH